MRFVEKLQKTWSAIRWKMLIIFAFFSVISTLLIGCFSVAVLNVVIRRESAYLIEERIYEIVGNRYSLTPGLLDRVHGCNAPTSNLTLMTDYLGTVWSESQTSIAPSTMGATRSDRPTWLDSRSFADIVVNHGSLEILSSQTVQREDCSVTILVRTPLSQSFLEQLSKTAGLQLSNSTPIMLRPYRDEEGMRGEIEANFFPGSRRPVPVVVTSRDWQTGRREDWVVCQVRPSYTRTVGDLSHMGLRTASWVAPLGSIAFGLVLVYSFGLLLSVRLSQRIVGVIDGLSHAAIRVGKGDFSARVPVPEQDQLGMLAESFNEMTRDLETLREQEKQTVVLERDIALAREVQQSLYPRTAAVLAADVCGITRPARVVSGDLYDFLPFSDREVGLLCADVSGKGVSAALMMAHLQALAHGRLLAMGQNSTRPAPDGFVTALNRDLRGRFGDSRYATMFYGEFDSQNNVLRYINAGHCPPVLVSGPGEATKLSGGDLPVGLFPEITYQERRVLMPKGSAIVVYTDGVTDALNTQGEEFGEEKLMNFCRSLPEGVCAEQICRLLSDEIAEWSAGVEPFDDTTILVLAVK
jgi:serine phosphatase RsbU (regulator of sigma subunit)